MRLFYIFFIGILSLIISFLVLSDENNFNNQNCAIVYTNIKIKTLPVSETENMVLVKEGSFLMGNNTGDADEKPAHQVELRSYYIDKFEVNAENYCMFLNAKGNQAEGGATWVNIQDEDCPIIYSGGKYIPKKNMAKHPMVVVTWYGSIAYAKWLGKRLPSEAEWEYAARGGRSSKNYKYAGSNTPNKVAWFDDNSDGLTFPVGRKMPNELGLYDMTGNVCEWCNDWYSPEYYKKAPGKNPLGPSGRYDFKILRGGAWISIAKQLRVTARDYAYPYNAYNQNGFRCAKDTK